MRARPFLPAVLAAGILTLTGCGSGGGATSPDDAGTAGATTATAPASAPASAGSGSSRAVPEALRFTGTTLDGKPFDGATLAGKPAVLWFWAPWCPKCKAQGPETAKVAAEFKGKANVIGVAGLDQPEAMKRFVSSTKIDGFPNLSDEPGTIWKKFEITEQSTYVVLDKDGETVFTGVLPGGRGLSDKLDGLVG
ncbi:redoxin domain-containing protein [Streptomyces sp. H27-C3]|uniref:redoxin domain-containing protein n=1 Tax=Streptomyces sp. H27-C3 TaxID=3046305 RepID=UPI0024BA2CE6|nr:redoxin domain-containing protein [Streptomyces sp. H27-C3]MDJ0462972.1 redoxin domain-containing protein [Streptomyces sp. H27-C3]